MKVYIGEDSQFNLGDLYGGGQGNGIGFGYCEGCGVGSGDGDGSGSGFGDGDGSGYGDGNEFGDGLGVGVGFGNRISHSFKTEENSLKFIKGDIEFIVKNNLILTREKV